MLHIKGILGKQTSTLSMYRSLRYEKLVVFLLDIKLLQFLFACNGNKPLF